MIKGEHRRWGYYCFEEYKMGKKERKGKGNFRSTFALRTRHLGAPRVPFDQDRGGRLSDKSHCWHCQQFVTEERIADRICTVSGDRARDTGDF